MNYTVRKSDTTFSIAKKVYGDERFAYTHVMPALAWEPGGVTYVGPEKTERCLYCTSKVLPEDRACVACGAPC